MELATIARNEIVKSELTHEDMSDASLSTLARANLLRKPEAMAVSAFLKSIDGRPLSDRILVYPLPKDDHYGSIIIPENAQDDQLCGIVVGVGRGRYENGALIPSEVSEGNFVIFSKYSGRKLNLDGVEVFQLTEQDINFVASGNAHP
jgi:chaperonin GroES